MSSGSQTPPEARDGMLPDDWAALSPLVDAVLDLPNADREARILALTNGDAERAQTLRALIADCERDMPELCQPAPEQFAALIADEPEQALPKVLGDRYRIEREIGRGGMARVFLALDTKHNRNVAVKVIRPELAASLGRERFLREIAIAARLRHPNIVPLYDSGDADGVLYFVMPFEDGESLRQRIEQGTAMPASEYVSVLRDVARALAYAHEQGVVHRDVKPDNVMLSGGAAVVTDFGIAKAVSVAQGDSSGTVTTLTQTGSGVGTPTYMAPEQAIGDPATNHRADIYAFGCVAYELITGRPPFHDLPAHQIVAAHVALPPIPIREVQANVSDSLATLVMQCLAKDPDARPQTGKALLDVLERGQATSPPAGASGSVVQSRTARMRTRSLLLIGAALAAAITGYAVLRRPVSAATQEVTVAVLPLQSGSDNAEQRAIAEGLSDEVATKLFRVAGLHVMSRRGVANYRDQRELNTETLGRALGARFLVTGTLREVDGRLRVLAQLVRASDNALLWSDQFDRAQNELSAVRDEIARAIGDTLSQLVPASARIVRGGPAGSERVVNPEAFRFYVLGQRALDRRGQSIQSSVDNFTQAVAIDSSYAEAWAGLSLAYALTPYFKFTSALSVDSVVRRAAARALSLDSTLAPAHVALGLQHQHEYQWDSAGTEFRAAVRLRTAVDVEPLIQYGRHLLFRGRVREGMAQFRAARLTEPASALVSSWVSYAYYLDGQLDSALAESKRAYQNDSTNMTTLTLGAVVRQRLGMVEEAHRFAGKSPAFGAMRIYIFALQRDTAESMRLIREGERSQPRSGTLETNRAFAMLGLGDTSAALTGLERATDAGESWPSFESAVDPMFEPLWGSARFRALLQRVRLREVVVPPVRSR